MKKSLGILILCIAGISSLAAAALTATITEVAGKVEYKLPGKDWVAAKTGTVLPAGSLISTGFKSTAILKTESATLTVKPVTRLSLEELVKSEGTTKTQMFLMAGRVKAEVTPRKGEQAEFKVKSPTATASVRGTGFEFDGQNLLVDHGAVQFESDTGIGISQTVTSGEFSTLSQTGTVTAPVAVATGDSDNPLRATQSASIAAANNTDSINMTKFIDPEIRIPVSIAIGWED
nr:FecR domain-containing protein [uncultured Treponema sp.]